MKRLLLLLLLFSSSTLVSAQTQRHNFGIRLSPMWTYSQHSELNDFEWSGGLYYRYTLFDLATLESGINYMQLSPFESLGDSPANTSYKKAFFDIVEIPLLVSCQFAQLNKTPVSFHLTTGYSYGRIIKSDILLNSPELIERQPMELTGGQRNVHFLNAGFEMRYTLNEKYRFSYGTMLKMTELTNQPFGKVYNFSAFLKVGWILK